MTATRVGRDRPVGIGIHGLGVAGAMMLEAARRHPGYRVVAVSDRRMAELSCTGLDSGWGTYDGLVGLLGDDGVEVVHVATPTALHFADVTATLGHGRHAIVEKPVTADLGSAAVLAARAAASGRTVLVGHSKGFDPWVRATSDAVRSGLVGPVERVVSTSSSEWLRRPRLDDELDPGRGGGLLYRQAVHQVDAIRTVLGGAGLSVRHVRTRPDPGRGVPGSYLVWLDSDTGASVSVFLDGTGRLLDTGRRAGPTAQPPTGRARPGAEGPDDAQPESDKRRLSDAIVSSILDGRVPDLAGHEKEGLVVVGSDGEIRASRHSVQVIRPDRPVVVVDLAAYTDGRTAVLDELLASFDGSPGVHDAGWGLDNMRICKAIDEAAGDPSPDDDRGDRWDLRWGSVG